MPLWRVVREERDGDLEWPVGCHAFYIAQLVWFKCRLLSPWKRNDLGKAWALAFCTHDVGNTSALFVYLLVLWGLSSEFSILRWIADLII